MCSSDLDPLCESYTYMSPYNYCLDNPVNAFDPDGRDPFSGAAIGALAEIGSQMIEKYDTRQSVIDNLAHNVNWKNVVIAAGEGALTSGVSAFKGLGAKVAVSAVSSTIKEVTDQFHNGAKSYKDFDYAGMGENIFANTAITFTAGIASKIATKIKYKNVIPKPSAKATMHYRAGQKRWNKSTMRNARKRLQNKKNKYHDKWENSINAFMNGIVSYLKR